MLADALPARVDDPSRATSSRVPVSGSMRVLSVASFGRRRRLRMRQGCSHRRRRMSRPQWDCWSSVARFAGHVGATLTSKKRPEMIFARDRRECANVNALALPHSRWVVVPSALLAAGATRADVVLLRAAEGRGAIGVRSTPRRTGRTPTSTGLIGDAGTSRWSLRRETSDPTHCDPSRNERRA